MVSRKNMDEHLESLWYIKEQVDSDNFLETYMGNDFNIHCVKNLTEEGFIVPSKSKGLYNFTTKGQSYTRRLIRAHRLAERLLNDVLGIEDYEIGACEFEHIMDTSVIDSLCTLLGHPKKCPHGLPIPEGNCCKRKDTTVKSPIRPLTDFKPGDRVRIVYVYSESNQQLHILENMQIRPGTEIKIHQTYPTFVIECEGGSIALDEKIAADIHAWNVESSNDSQPRQRGRRHHKNTFHHGGFFRPHLGGHFGTEGFSGHDQDSPLDDKETVEEK